MASELVLLVTPTDRHRDAERLTQAGIRVIATSQAASSARQIIDARPAAIVVELVPSLGYQTLSLLSQLVGPSEIRRIPVLVYGSADATLVSEVVRLGGRWVSITSADRRELVSDVRRALIAEVLAPGA